MSLHTALTLLTEEYDAASKEGFAGSAVADFVRSAMPEAIKAILSGNDRYVVQGSPGQGNWAKVPWVGIFDRLITESAQDGYYLVYLLKEDCSGIYLSLNQGVTQVRTQYGADAKRALQARAADFLARIGAPAEGLIQGRISLAATSSASLGAYYEQGAICSIFYKKGEIPGDSALSEDLLRLIEIYFGLVSQEPRLFAQADAEEDEENLGVEDLRRLREHKRIERNQRLSKRAKQIHGVVCTACGFDFEKHYGPLGSGFIEAHHLMPLSELHGQKIALNAETDFTVLCANCHRMIHRSEFVGSIREFRAKYVVRAEIDG